MTARLYILLTFFLTLACSLQAQNEQDEVVFSSDFEFTTFNNPFDGNEFDYFVSIEPSIDQQKSDELEVTFDELITKLEKRKSSYRSDKAFLRHLFYRVHKKALKNYVSHATVNSTLQEGNYDCVTGTAIYGLVLDKLGYTYDIRELDYHIFLQVEADDNLVLMESTDPLYGFYDDERSINRLLQQFDNDQESAEEYSFRSKSNNVIGLKELAGLQYYNQAIQLYNEHQFEAALSQVEKAMLIYDSPRIREVRNLIKAFVDSPTVAMTQRD